MLKQLLRPADILHTEWNGDNRTGNDLVLLRILSPYNHSSSVMSHHTNSTASVDGRRPTSYLAVFGAGLLVVRWLHKHTLYSVSQNFFTLPRGFLKFFPNGWEFLIKSLHACYSFILTLNCKILFNYPQLWQSYAVLSATTQWIFTFHNTSVTSFTNWW